MTPIWLNEKILAEAKIMHLGRGKSQLPTRYT